MLTCRTEQVDLSRACAEVAQKLTIMSCSDNITTMLNFALLSKLESQTANLSLDVADHFETTASACRLLYLTKTLNQWSNLVESHEDALLRLERSIISTPEANEELIWPQILKNKANVGTYHVGYPGEQYLETRKIFLSQGATLILLHWQDELDEFVDEVEQVSGSSRA